MGMDVLITPILPPQIIDNQIVVTFTATGKGDSIDSYDPIMNRTIQVPAQIMQITFTVTYQYGKTNTQRQVTILTAARSAYIAWCAENRVAPLPVDQMRVEAFGIDT